MPLTLDAARVAIDEAVRIATADGKRISIGVVDAVGRQVAGIRMDGANWFTLGVALAKAQTAATFRRPSDSLSSLKGDYPELFEQIEAQLTFRPTTLPGGVPILDADGETIGAVGVSGAFPEQDLRIAQAAVESLAVAD